MKAASLLAKLVEAEEYSDWETVQLLKGVYSVEDADSPRLWRLIDELNRVVDRLYSHNNIGSQAILEILMANNEEELTGLDQHGWHTRHKWIIAGCRTLLKDLFDDPQPLR